MGLLLLPGCPTSNPGPPDLANSPDLIQRDGGSFVDLAQGPDLVPVASCTDGVRNGNETGVDCGGSCPACALGQGCLQASDCASNVCVSGLCVECGVAADCLGQDTECQTRTCTANRCGIAYVPVGTPVTTQVVGDCHVNECDGQGNVVPTIDNTDRPVDNNACTQDLCTGGTPSNPPLPQGTSCGTALLCDDQGRCVGCNTAADCAGQDTECRVRTCVNNACGVSYTPSGTRVTAQVVGDCQVQQCDGAGNVVAAIEDADLPVDGNLCTQDLCTVGAPSNPLLPLGSSCGTNRVCSASGDCGECNTAADCPGQDTECQARTCVNKHLRGELYGGGDAHAGAGGG